MAAFGIVGVLFGLIFLAMFIFVPFFIVRNFLRITSKVRLGREIANAYDSLFRNVDNQTTGRYVSLLRRTQALNNSPASWNQMRNIYEVVSSSTNVDDQLKKELSMELTRLGVNLRGPSFSNHSSADSGEDGERETAYQLEYLGKDYRIFNGIFLRVGDKAQELDHVVVGENGIFHIDSKNYQGELRFTDTGLEQNGKPIKDPTNQMHRHAFVIHELLRRNGITADVTGILCFTNEKSELIGTSPDFVTIKVGRLLSTIKNYQAKHPLSSEEVSKISSLIKSNSKPSKVFERSLDEGHA